MKKQSIALSLIICLLCSNIGFAEAAQQESCCSLSIDDSLIELATAPRLIDGVVMLPMREFFERLGATVTWYQDSQTVTAYKYNMQVKLQIGQPIAYRNGNMFRLAHAPVIVDDKTYLPAQFVAESFDMRYQYSDSAIKLTRRDVSKTYFIDFLEYSSIAIDEYDMTLILPYGWAELSDNRFGIEDDYEDYSIAISRYPANAASETALAAKIKAELSAELADKITFSYDEPLYAGDLIYHSFGYLLKDEADERVVDNYILKNGDFYYLFKCDSAANSDIPFIRSASHSILKRLQFNASTIATGDEHYFEYEAFFSAQMSLDEPLSSNMEVFNYLPFSGKIGIKNAYVKLTAVVSKGDETIEFNIQVDQGGHFNAKIFTPFGLAKHNVAIYGQRSNGSRDLLLRFSALNLSSEAIKYLIPSDYVQSNKTEALSLASFLTYQTTSSYLKAKAIFEHVVSEIELRDTTVENLDDLQNSTEIITARRATPLEMCIATTALLRAADISAKLIASYGDGQIYYAVEAHINGLWVIYDPVNYLRQQAAQASGQASETIAKFSALAPFYYVKQGVYRPLFNNYRVLSY